LLVLAQAFENKGLKRAIPGKIVNPKELSVIQFISLDLGERKGLALGCCLAV
jgi:hypothetical protein